ncbi:hypothetical protein AG1IA_04943 [Rhizoctonia solani AG-1 IA]|uniref:Uncharacterized protein n=1 Tax=Thanatephorus cucumeris (strain AG1-IA) TaxID=983506 RepID=L8WSB4_THACA|nr:hypothetical protein AG1IA_04943 [Rhizoctonia solani AG-1 IA]
MMDARYKRRDALADLSKALAAGKGKARAPGHAVNSYLGHHRQAGGRSTRMYARILKTIGPWYPEFEIQRRRPVHTGALRAQHHNLERYGTLFPRTKSTAVTFTTNHLITHGLSTHTHTRRISGATPTPMNGLGLI